MNAASAPLFADALQPRDRLDLSATPSSGPPGAWPVAILGIPFDPLTRRGALERIEDMIASRRPHHVALAGVTTLVQARDDAELRRSLLRADLTLAEDAAVIWASRCLGNALPEAIAGGDFLSELMQAAAARSHRIFFLGATPRLAVDAVRQLSARFPGVIVAGHYAPPFAALLEMDHAEILRRVHEAKPDLLLVAFGGAQEEKWIALHHTALGAPVTLGLGAVSEFFTGKKRPALAALRNRAAALARFGPLVAVQAWQLGPRRAIGGGPQGMEVPLRDWCGVCAGASLTRRALETYATFWAEMAARHAHCLIDLSAVEHVDGTGVAFLMHWQKFLRSRGRQLVLLAPGMRFRRALAALHVTDYFAFARDTAEVAAHAGSFATPPPARQDAGMRALAWCGEIIAANADDVWRMTTDHVRAFAAGGASLVIIDLARLRFIDSAGADVMVRLVKWAGALRAQILFVHAEDNVRNVLRLTHLDHVLLEGSQ